jgi:hypothetical protein
MMNCYTGTMLDGTTGRICHGLSPLGWFVTIGAIILAGAVWAAIKGRRP